MPRIKDIKGRRSGMLVAIKPTGERKNNNVLWLCQWDCGGTRECIASGILQERVKSCGCVPRGTGIEGLRSGTLTVLHPSGTRKSNSVLWLCRCDCGGLRECTVSDILHEKVKSCGCVKRGKGPDARIAENASRKVVKMAPRAEMSLAKTRALLVAFNVAHGVEVKEYNDFSSLVPQNQTFKMKNEAKGLLEAKQYSGDRCI